MVNEIRNELLTILAMNKHEEKDKDFYLKELLNRFEYDINDKLEEYENEIKVLKSNLELLEHVRNELFNKKEV